LKELKLKFGVIPTSAIRHIRQVTNVTMEVELCRYLGSSFLQLVNLTILETKLKYYAISVMLELALDGFVVV
jgi:hypothetical protein